MIGLRLDSEGAAACSCCWRTGRPARPRPRCPAEAGRACSPAPSPCRGPGRRLRRLQVPRPTLPLPWQLRGLLLLLPGPPSTRRPRPRPWLRRRPLPPPQPPLPSMACAAPRSTSCARCPASSRRGSDLRWWLRLRPWAGQYIHAHVLGSVPLLRPQGPLLPALRRPRCVDGP